jgi:hypothetical protein
MECFEHCFLGRYALALVGTDLAADVGAGVEDGDAAVVFAVDVDVADVVLVPVVGLCFLRLGRL